MVETADLYDTYFMLRSDERYPRAGAREGALGSPFKNLAAAILLQAVADASLVIPGRGRHGISTYGMGDKGPAQALKWLTAANDPDLAYWCRFLDLDPAAVAEAVLGFVAGTPKNSPLVRLIRKLDPRLWKQIQSRKRLTSAK